MSFHPPEKRDAILADRAAGMKVTDIATKHGVGVATVSRYTRQAGLPAGGVDRTADYAAAVADYETSGQSIRAVAQRHPISQESLRKALREAGVPLRKGNGTPVDIKKKAIDDFLSGDSIRDVAETHKMSTSTISAWLAAAGVTAEDRPESAYAPTDYTGGWIIRRGVKYPAQPVRKRAA